MSTDFIPVSALNRFGPLPASDFTKTLRKGRLHEKDFSNFSDNYLEYYESNKRMRQWVNKQYQNGNRLGWDDD
jgi:hypothetical protein